MAKKIRFEVFDEVSENWSEKEWEEFMHSVESLNKLLKKGKVEK